MKKLIHGIANIYQLVAFFCLVAFIGILTTEIVLRYFFSSSLIWSQELFSFLVCWFTFLGFAKLVVLHEDIRITYLVKKMNKKMLAFNTIINSLLMLLVSGLLLYYSIFLTIRHMSNTTVIMGAPTAFYYVPLVLLLILIVLNSIYETYLAFRSKLDLFPEEGE